MIRCVEVSLLIPDNEARTALTTLQRLGVDLSGLERADLYRCDVADEAAEGLVAALRASETIYNPNVHALRVRPDAFPGTGEVWVDEIAPAPVAEEVVYVAGRVLPGVRALERFVAWRLFSAPGIAASSDLVAVATETLLCNAAFQKAIRV